MASPQKENGYLQIALELVEALARVELSPNESRVLWVIIRKTYGWKKKVDAISVTTFCLLTGLPDKSARRSLKSLIEKKIIIAENIQGSRGGQINTYQIQKNYEIWAGHPPVNSDPPNPRSTATPGPRSAMGATPGQLPVWDPGSAATPSIDNKDKQKITPKPAFSFQGLKEEVNTFKKMGWQQQKIKDHFLMREVPEKDIDWAMQKLF